MAPRRKWWHTLQASKGEARLAIDLYNRSGNERQLEAFIVHMNLGWTKVLQARTELKMARLSAYRRLTASRYGALLSSLDIHSRITWCAAACIRGRNVITGSAMTQSR